MIKEFGLQENIARNVIAIDGISRCGKSILSSIIPSLEGVEQLRFITLLEHVVPALALGVMDKSCARSSMRTLMNEIAYDTMLSRNANFRPGDLSGITNYARPGIYVERLTREEGPPVIEELRNSSRMFPYMTHDMMVNLEYFDALEIDYRMVEMYRHPVDNLHSWYVRGWGERFGYDPQSFTLCIESGGQLLPWYCSGYAGEWLKMNSMERCIHTGLDLLRQSIAQHRKAPHSKRIITITFENFVQNTQEEMDRLCAFLGTKASAWTPAFLDAARCPRVLDAKERARKMEDFRQGISAKLFNELMSMSEQYETDVYGLCKA